MVASFWSSSSRATLAQFDYSKRRPCHFNGIGRLLLREFHALTGKAQPLADFLIRKSFCLIRHG